MKHEMLSKNHENNHVALVFFLAREKLNIFAETFEAACAALRQTATMDFLINGNFDLAESIKKFIQERHLSYPKIHFRVWYISTGDKANAWNLYIHKIWELEDVAFFIDGYVRIHPNSIKSLLQSLEANPDALGGTGVPTEGRSAKMMRSKMLEVGGFHGNLCCIKGSVIEEMRSREIRLPVGLYRVDSLMGAILYLGLNPKEYNWQTDRITVCVGASWSLNKKHWWRFSDIKAKKNQIERQLRGSIENAAVKYFFMVRKKKPEELASDCRSLIKQWENEDNEGFEDFMRSHPFAYLVNRRYKRRIEDWSSRNQFKLIGEENKRREKEAIP